MRRLSWSLLVMGLLACLGATAVPPAPLVSYGVGADTFHPVKARHGMVASVDAAVAVGFTLVVTHPQAGNIGGGFMLLRTLIQPALALARQGIVVNDSLATT